ncbi:MAG: transporter drug/metabolite exporter family [Gammaproteobacteria bacterium]|jgi:drug/metabolite transporter (DMT)-like permease|nr:transporter drug/metabolite exporter family [Gammaproteobacteria bacterium]
MERSFKADFFLLLTTLIWGGTFPLIENAVAYIDPTWFVAIRFLFASLFLLPWIFIDLHRSNRKLLVGGLILGAINASSFILQTMGLKTVDAPTTAFITSTYVIMVPFLLPLFKLGKAKKLDILCSMICLGGLYALTNSHWTHLSAGEILVLACAVFTALGIVYLQKISRSGENLPLLAFYQILFVVPIAGAFAVKASPQLPVLNHTVIFALLYCSLFATAIALFLQTTFQRQTSATHAAIIYSLEPIFASLFAWAFNDAHIGRNILFGGSLIILSIIMAEAGQIFLKIDFVKKWLNALL